MAKKPGLWANIHAKRKRGESPAKKGSKDYPKTLDIGEGMKTARKNVGADTCWDGYKAKGTKKKDGKEVPNCVKEGKTFAEFCAEGKSRIETDSDYRKRFKALADNFAEKRKEQTKAKMKKESVEILDVDGNLVAEITDLILPEPMTGWKQQNVDEGAIADKMRANLKAKKKDWDSKGEKAKKDGYDALDKVKKTQADLDKSDFIQNVGEDYKKLPKGKMGMKAGKKIISAVGHAGKAGAEGEGTIEDQIRMQKAGKKTKQADKIHKTAGKHSETLSKMKSLKNKLKGLTKEEYVDEAAWTRKEGKNKTGGLNEKGRKSYERENPGSDLKAPQPEGGPRKKSFCARMGGMEGPLKDEKGKPTRKKLALDKWKC